MNHERIQTLIDQLDAAAPRDGARVKLQNLGGGPDECHVVANRAGYLRLGVELLKAAYAPAGEGNFPDSVSVDVRYLLTADSTVVLDWFERREPELTRAPVYRADWILVAIFLMMAFVFSLTIIGVVTAFNWLRML